MKIGIITLHYFDNYGSVLQAYALQKSLSNWFGDSIELIDYKPIYLSGLSTFYQGYLNAYHENGLIPAFMLSLRYLTNKLYCRLHADLVIKMREIFANFRSSKLVISSNSYKSHEELILNAPKYDAYITGSDNLWLVDRSGGIPERRCSYYLDFAPADKKRISYAVSMRNPYIEKKHLQHFLSLIDNIDYISVRGKTTASFIQEISGKEVVSVVDPTLLLTMNEWNLLIPGVGIPPNDKPYILVYVIYPMSKRSPLYRYVKKISEDKGWDILYIGYTFHEYLLRYNYVSVEDFLRYFYHAKMVVTNSFHGTVFSLVYRKPFYAFSPQEGKIRITDLLSAMHLSERFVDDDSTLIQNLSFELDYTKYEQYIQYNRDFSLEWLHDVLNDKSKNILEIAS